MITSLDGYVADAEGNFDWAEPDAEGLAFVNEMVAPVGTFLYGRRMYEMMRYWETAEIDPVADLHTAEWTRRWRATDKVVFSTTLPEPDAPRTRVERTFDPAAVRELKESSDHDLTVDGPTLAAQAIRAGLVDEYHLLVCPVAVGGGTPYLPDGVRLDLDLLEERRFANGVLALRYRERAGA